MLIASYNNTSKVLTSTIDSGCYYVFFVREDEESEWTYVGQSTNNYLTIPISPNDREAIIHSIDHPIPPVPTSPTAEYHDISQVITIPATTM